MTICFRARRRTRTTIEVKDSHRAALLEIADRRGWRGFSAVVGEAIDAYLEAQRNGAAAQKAALALRGSLAAAEANRLRRVTRTIRESWR